MSEQLRERLAELAHEQWSGWMDYLFSKSRLNADDAEVIPATFAERWKRQMATPYAELSESEKNSDRIEADKFLAVFKQDGNARAERAEAALRALVEAGMKIMMLFFPVDYRVGVEVLELDKAIEQARAVLPVATEEKEG